MTIAIKYARAEWRPLINVAVCKSAANEVNSPPQQRSSANAAGGTILHERKGHISSNNKRIKYSIQFIICAKGAPQCCG